MDFGALPPEINSGRMYSGPGSAPMVAAATAWNGLAAELNSVAVGYDKVITQLGGEEWLGPASAAMVEAVTPFVVWMSAAANQAEEAAAQARTAAAAFEAAFAAVVPPPLIAANRAELVRLISTNVFGQNTSAIAATEAQYGQMWAQDAAAMYGYAASSATASTVTPFTEPPAITSPSAQTGQAAAVATAAGVSAGAAQETLRQLLSALPTTLGNLAAPLTSSVGTEIAFLQSSQGPLSWLWQILFGTTTFPTSISGLLTALQPYASFIYNTEGLPYFSIGMANNFVQTSKTLGLLGGAAPAAASALGDAAKGMPGLGGPVSGGLGNAASIGKLSVPPVWSEQLPGAMQPGAAPLPVGTISAAPEAGPANLLGGMPLAGSGAGAGGAGPRYGFRPTVMARPPFAG
ncbi:putative PPE family protein PPE29 [Mycobacterium basiliense]|uniref:Putative PPE family protein PPE29 n=1 Tax=Mycobacterium basiliense TaxID=2094119 RepID=A0A3S4BIA0_9MYCO|nr:PPE family protein [Mycobacterium basiliense]VDM88896.1 putative PPE family protein PPE29 [Mycobacterium basiliense]